MGKIYKVIGLMSGTSLDGVDVAYCHFEYNDDKWSYKIIDTETVEYPDSIRERIKNTLNMSGVDLVRLDLDLGGLYGQLVSEFIERYDIQVDFVSSHGHTIYHQPEEGFTFQAGNGHAISQGCKLPVVYDFRTADLIMGGQGAPLVPIGDQLLFPEYNACINLGGIANISFIKGDERLAFDVCPANMPLNIMAGKMGHDFDKDGEIARKGSTNDSLLLQLNQLEYYSESGPKSMGYEWVMKNIMPLIENSEISIPDILSTLVEHTAYQIGTTLQKEGIKGRVLITGGGALNIFLRDRIEFYLPEEINIDIPQKELVVYKEALVFAFMGVLRWDNKINILSSATGSLVDHSAGSIIQL